MSRQLTGKIPKTDLQPLIYETNDARILKLLLQEGAENSIKNYEGKTAYDYAVMYGNKYYIDILKH